jgi:hypothetical protein
MAQRTETLAPKQRERANNTIYVAAQREERQRVQLVAGVAAPVRRQAQAGATDNHNHRGADVAGERGTKDR